ncbi:MAG: cysteine synthase A [Bacillota bacterium]
MIQMPYQGIHELIGNTPIVKLNKITDGLKSDIYLKLEWYNPGGSVKDRIALNMIEDAEEKGLIKPGDTIIEPTSGNTGIGLALVAASKGYRLIVTMPDSLSIERRKILKGYGAEPILTDGKKGMKESIRKAKALAEEHGYFMPMQFDNPANPEAHQKTTAKEIMRSFKTLDAFVAGVDTGGTLSGVGTSLKKHYDQIQIVAVEPEDSAVLSGSEPGPHKIQGIGAGFIPSVLDTSLIDTIETIGNEEAMETARKLAKEEGLFVGISTGANVAAALKIARRSKAGSTILTVSPSNAERYLSTDLFKDV